MTPQLRLLPFAAADGPTHMAADEALLETAADRGLASLNFEKAVGRNGCVQQRGCFEPKHPPGSF